MTAPGYPQHAQDTSSFDGDPQVESLHENMVAAGERIEEKRIIDYFGTPEPLRFYLGDETQYFEFTPLTEGGKAKYERATNKDIRVQRTTGDAKMQVDPATERQALVMLSVTDALIYKRQKPLNQLKPVAFQQAKNGTQPNEFWQDIFEVFPPKVIQDLYRKIRDANPWMKADEDVETLEEEYKNMGQRIETLKEEQAKKKNS